MVKDERGLTLIEVLIVVSILVILLSLLIPNIVSSKRKAEEKMCHSTQMMVEAQIELYKLDQRTTFSTNDVSKIFEALIKNGYIKENPICPSGGTYSWDPQAEKLSCSVHDHHSDPKGNGNG